MAPLAIARRSATLDRLLREHAGEDAGVLTTALTALFTDADYDRSLAREAERVARDSSKSWPTRRVAALMLETTLARTNAAGERTFWCERLLPRDAAERAREGYAAGQPIEPQLWRRLVRNGRIHRLTLHSRWNERAVRDYLDAGRSECRLTFARQLFSPDEVIARIERDVRRSRGLRDAGPYGRFAEESQHAIAQLPELERRIVEHLAKDGVVRWAALSTTSDLNSLIEQPAGTVVLTVKPPGSTHEIEIKRAGLVRDLPLAVVWARNNYIVPSSHHLDGGAMHQLLTYEAEHSAFLSSIFRAVHGVDASMSRTLYLAVVHGIATPDGEADLIEYFTDRRVFADRYDDMRRNMYDVVKTLTGYRNEPFEEPFNDFALTGSFIGFVKPAQAIQLGTTAFRLDRVERYLSAKGPQRYFREGLGRDWTADDARRFADALLDEILGVYEPPRTTWRSHAQYVEAAFRVPANRARANETYVSALEQVGRFWGTLLALRGHTQGESFVGRNAGLRSVWRDGRWAVDLVFMDHDSLAFASLNTRCYRPIDSVANAAKDAKHILGGVYNRTYRVRGELWYLRRIYRAGSVVERRGVQAFRAAMKAAYDRTHEAIRNTPELRELFDPKFVENLRDWDELVTSYIRTAATPAARRTWKEASRARLSARGYEEKHADEHVRAVTLQAKFLRRISFLF